MRQPDITSRVNDVIWRRSAAREPRYKAVGLKALRILYVIVRDLRDGQLNLRAMGLVYTTLLSIVPLLALSLSVLKGFGVHNEVAPLLHDFFSPLGDKGAEISDRILEFVDRTRVGVLSSVGIVLLLYTALSVMQKIESALNHIWHVTRPRRLTERFSDYISVLLIGPVLVVTSTGLSGAAMSNSVVEGLAKIEPLGTLIRFAAVLVPLVLAVAAFAFIYVFVPNTKVKVKSAIVGGTAAAILWKISGWAFATFVVASGKYEAVYSAFATLIVFMIWLYVSWLILMIGASVAFYHQSPAFLTLSRERRGLSARVKEKLALLVMQTVAAAYYAGGQAPTTATLATACGVPTEAAGDVIQALLRAGHLLALDGNEAEVRFVPGKPPDVTTIAGVLLAIRSDEEDEVVGLGTLASSASVDEAARQVAVVVEDALGGKTVKDLLSVRAEGVRN